MITGDRDPSLNWPVTDRWAGSTFTIQDVEGIMADVVGDGSKVCLYDRSDFPFPIDNMNVVAKVAKDDSGEQDGLSLTSTIQLDKKNASDQYFLAERVKTHIAPTGKTARDYFREPPFTIRNLTFANTFHVTDDETGSRFLLWYDEKNLRFTISNDLRLTAKKDWGDGESVVEIKPPALHTIAPADQLMSLMKASAFVADFSNALYSDKLTRRVLPIHSSPLRREYVVGGERNVIEQGNPFAALGEAATKATASGAVEDVVDKVTAPVPASSRGRSQEKTVERGVTLDDVGGLYQIRQQLKEIAVSFRHPEVMTKWGASRPQGVLLYGEPGTGKTMLATALAHEIGADLWPIQTNDLYEKWLGDSGRRVKELFTKLKAVKKPTILFLDEFDTLFTLRDDEGRGGATTERNAVAGIFKQEMNTLADNPNVLVVATANDLDSIDPSLIRSGRFDHRIYVPMPDEDSRNDIIAGQVYRAVTGRETEDFKIFDDLTVRDLAKLTDGMSGADIEVIFKRLLLSRAMQEARSGQAQPPITQAEIIETINGFRIHG